MSLFFATVCQRSENEDGFMTALAIVHTNGENAVFVAARGCECLEAKLIELLVVSLRMAHRFSSVPSW
jgi:hypothetical protein